MGNSSSSQLHEANAQREEQARKRRLEDEAIKHRQTLEKEEQRLKHEEHKLKLQEEREQNYRTKSDEDRVKLEERDRISKSEDYKHIEAMRKIEELEKCNTRKDELESKKIELEHARLLDTQGKIFEILKETFGKVQNVDMNQAALAACVLQSIQSGEPVDKDVLKEISSKIPSAPPSQQVVAQIVDKMMKADQDDEEYLDRIQNRNAQMVAVSPEF